MSDVRVLAFAVLLFAAPTWADAPKRSIYPAPRPAALSVELPATAPAAIAAGTAAVPHPRLRPLGLVAKADRAVVASITPAVISRPRARPSEQTAPELAMGLPAEDAPIAKRKTVKTGKQSLRGSVCGDPDIRGEVLAPIGSSSRGCGIAEPVKVTSISGVGFSQPATIDCTTAKALKKWMVKGMQPAFGRRKVVKLHIFGSYMCRSRNNVKGAKISEHGRGKAVDIAGFIFADGKEWSVAKDYNKTIRKAQKAACGTFGTTLGPGSDGYHEDHLHFDTAKYRGGAYCR
jgi:hypothetical protein